MKRNKRILKVLAFCSPILALPLISGCGISSTSAAPKNLKIVYWFPKGVSVNAMGMWLSHVRTQFEKTHPGVHVSFQKIVSGESAYYTKLDLMQSSTSTAPDVVMEDTFLISSDASAGYLKNLTPLLKKWSGWKQYFPALKSITTYGGKTWGIPYSTDARYLWYNKNLFKKAGLPVPWHPSTWAQVLSAAHTIKRKVPGVIPMNVYSGIPMGESATMQGFEMLLYGTGNSLYDYSTHKWVVKSPGFLSSLQLIKNLYGSHLGPPLSEALTSTMGSLVETTLLPKQKLAIDLDGMWLPGAWKPGTSSPWPQWTKVMGYTPMPTENGQSPHYTSLSGGWALSISKKAQHPNLAWSFIKLACNKQNTAYINAHWVTLSPRKDSATTHEYLSAAPNMGFSTNMLKYTFYRPAFPAYAKISYQIQQAMEEVMTGKMTPQQAMNQYASAVTKIVGTSHVEVLHHAETAAQLRPSAS